MDAFISSYIRRGVSLCSLMPRRLRAIFCRFGWSASALFAGLGAVAVAATANDVMSVSPGDISVGCDALKGIEASNAGNSRETRHDMLLLTGYGRFIVWVPGLLLRAKSMHIYEEQKLPAFSMRAAAAGFPLETVSISYCNKKSSNPL